MVPYVFFPKQIQVFVVYKLPQLEWHSSRGTWLWGRRGGLSIFCSFQKNDGKSNQSTPVCVFPCLSAIENR